VRLCTAADRRGFTDLVWLSWEGAKRKGARSRPGHGSTLLAISAAGGRKLHAAMQAGEFAKRHADLALITYVTHCRTFRACYVYPSVGHYQGHLSQSSDGEGFRSSTWDNTWVQEGTRRDPVKKNWNRYIMPFLEKGVEWGPLVMLPEPEGTDLRWFMLAPSAALHDVAPEPVAGANAPEPVAGAGEEDSEDEEEGWWRGKGKGKQRRKAKAKVIQPLHPDVVRAMKYEGSPAGTMTQRQKRARRAMMANYGYRILTADPDKVDPFFGLPSKVISGFLIFFFFVLGKPHFVKVGRPLDDS